MKFFYKDYSKRLFDLCFSMFVMILLSPIFFILSFLVKFTSHGPVFFKQVRIGKNRKKFTIYKFRTMYFSDDLSIQLRSVDDVTPIGAFMRRFKLDELPQFWNVFVGNMSVVGPRPFVEQDMNTIDTNGELRFDVHPGITGLGQVCGNTFLEWNERWLMDAIYVKKISLLLDLKIIILTFLVIFKGELYMTKYKDVFIRGN